MTEYVNGAYREAKAGVYDFSAYGTSTGPKLLEFDIGPFFDSVRYTIFSQSAAIQALKDGNIDFFLTPFTFPINQVENQPNVAVIQNSTNAFRYLGFNVRKQPMASTTFRQAVATLIDREYLVEELFPPLGTSNVEPFYGFVPVGNGFWHNASTTQIGKGLNLSQRVANALQLLKGGGFTFGTEPVISADGTSFQTTGSGLKMPDGNPVPEMEIIGPDATWDPLRAAANPWIVGRLNEFGIPATSTLTSFNNVVAALFSETVAQDMDMWMLGWGLGLFPDYLENFFHSRHIPENQVGFNWGGYSNSTIDSLGDSLIADTDVSSARNTAFQLQEILADDLPYVPLFIPPVVEAYRSDRIVYPYTQVLGGLAGAHRPQGSLGLAAVVKPKSAAITPVPSVTPWALVGLALLLLLLTLSGRARRAIGRRTDG